MSAARKRQGKSSSSSSKKAKSKTKAKKAATASLPATDNRAVSDELRELLERIDAHGDAGMPVGAPKGSQVDALGTVKKNGDYYAADQKRLDALGIDDLITRFGERTIDGVTTSLCTLNETGRRRLAAARESAAAQRESELLEQMQTLDGVREAVQGQEQRVAELGSGIGELRDSVNRGISRLQSALEEVRVEGARLVQAFEAVHGEAMPDPSQIAPGVASPPASAEAEAVAVPVPPADAPGIEPELAGFAEPVPVEVAETGATGDGLARAVLARIPADYWMEIPELFRQLHADGFSVLPGQLNDLLLALSEAGQIAFNIWMRTLTEIPAPEHGILQPDAKVLYYIRRA